MVAEMGNPHAPGKIGVTIKVPESKKYAGDNPWFVFEGTDPETVKRNIAKTFGLDVEGLVLSDVVINAQRLVTGLGAVAHGLGGTVVASGQQSTFQTPEIAPAASGAGVDWSKVAASTGASEALAPKADDPILAAVENATSIAELQQIWAENQAAFNEDKYMLPYKAKGRALQSA